CRRGTRDRHPAIERLGLLSHKDGARRRLRRAADHSSGGRRHLLRPPLRHGLARSAGGLQRDDRAPVVVSYHRVMRQSFLRAVIGLGALAVIVVGLSAQARPSTVTARTLKAPPRGEWLTYGRDQAETHFSPLTQISTTTVTRLARAWSTDLGAPG